MAEQIYKKFDLDKTDVLINGKQTVTIESLEWTKTLKEANTFRNGKVVSTASAVESNKGKISLEQSEKLIIAEELGSTDGTLSDLICDITATDDQGRKVEIKQARFSNDGYNLGKTADDKTSIDFTVLGDVKISSK